MVISIENIDYGMKDGTGFLVNLKANSNFYMPTWFRQAQLYTHSTQMQLWDNEVWTAKN